MAKCGVDEKSNDCKYLKPLTGDTECNRPWSWLSYDCIRAGNVRDFARPNLNLGFMVGNVETVAVVNNSDCV